MHGDRWLTQGTTRMFNVRTLANKVSVPMYFKAGILFHLLKQVKFSEN